MSHSGITADGTAQQEVAFQSFSVGVVESCIQITSVLKTECRPVSKPNLPKALCIKGVLCFSV